MYELKTKVNDADVKKFLETVDDDQKREDSFRVLDLMTKLTGKEPKMWGSSIVGFGTYKYTYASGHSGEWMVTGFSPRKTSLTIYLMMGFSENKDLMKKLGRHKTGKSCLYIKKLEDIDMKVLETLIKKDLKKMKDKYECS